VSKRPSGEATEHASKLHRNKKEHPSKRRGLKHLVNHQTTKDPSEQPSHCPNDQRSKQAAEQQHASKQNQPERASIEATARSIVKQTSKHRGSK
jgi:hypothetical protein